MTQQTPALIFVYNANSGLLNGALDLLHKTFSPHTYACNLCAITYNTLGMRRDWRDFVNGLPYPVHFLHRDELLARFGKPDHPLPAAFLHTPAGLQLFVSTDEMNSCHTLDDLMRLVRKQLPTT